MVPPIAPTRAGPALAAGSLTNVDSGPRSACRPGPSAAGGLGVGDTARTGEAHVTETMMLQTDTWRGTEVAPRETPALWWRRRRPVLLPQITLALGVLAILSGALWAVGEYDRQQAEVRVAETHRFLDQFRSGPVAAALGRVRAAWQAERARQNALLAELRAPGGSDPSEVRRDHRLLVLETIEEYGLQPEIEVVRQFVVRLATCVRVGSCDRNAAAAQLGPALWAFRDQHRPYFQLEPAWADLDAHLATIAPRAAAMPIPAASGR
jgi:hypothetical protein